MFILELNVTNKTHTSEKKLLESGAVIRSFRDRGAVTALAAVSRGQEEEAVRAVREQAAAHQTFLFRLQLKRFVFK